MESNASCISNLIEKRGKGWLCFIPLDFTGLDRPNEIIAESMLLGLPNINRDSMIQAIEETKASLTSLMLDYKVTDCFLTNSNSPSAIQNTDEGWTLRRTTTGQAIRAKFPLHITSGRSEKGRSPHRNPLW